MSEGEKALLVRVHGRVQGVGYRAWTVHEAKRLGLRGTVRNEADGSVSAVIAGTRSAVDRMLERFHNGPPGAAVTSVESEPLDLDHVPGDFRVLR